MPKSALIDSCLSWNISGHQFSLAISNFGFFRQDIYFPKHLKSLLFKSLPRFMLCLLSPSQGSPWVTSALVGSAGPTQLLLEWELASRMRAWRGPIQSKNKSPLPISADTLHLPSLCPPPHSGITQQKSQEQRWRAEGYRKGEKRLCLGMWAHTTSWVQPCQPDKHRGILSPINRLIKTEIEQL